MPLLRSLSPFFVAVAIKIWLLRSHGAALELAKLQAAAQPSMTQLDPSAIALATAEAAPSVPAAEPVATHRSFVPCTRVVGLYSRASTVT
jgi:hypothetical protein